MAINTIKTRIQLKSDTEENWNKAVLVSEGGTKTSGTSFVPLMGEVITYLADNTHPFSRFKVGDGINNVVALPFVDGQSIINISRNGTIFTATRVDGTTFTFTQQDNNTEIEMIDLTGE